MADQLKKRSAASAAPKSKPMNARSQARDINGAKAEAPKPRNVKQNAKTAAARAEAREKKRFQADDRHKDSKSKMSNITPETTDQDLADIRYGRPSEFRPIMIEQVRKLCQLGATDAEVAHFFGVTRYAIIYWKLNNPHFLEAMRTGKELADERVERSLFARAVGFEHPAVKVFYNHKTGEVVEHQYTEIYAPDTEAARFWLMNRRPDLWRMHREAPPLDPGEAAEVAQMAVAKAMATSVRQAEGVPPDAKVKAG